MEWKISLLGSRREVVFKHSHFILSFCFFVVLAINVNLCGSENFLLKTLLLPSIIIFLLMNEIFL
jgi:hypothetical protein